MIDLSGFQDHKLVEVRSVHLPPFFFECVAYTFVHIVRFLISMNFYKTECFKCLRKWLFYDLEFTFIVVEFSTELYDLEIKLQHMKKNKEKPRNCLYLLLPLKKYTRNYHSMSMIF